MPRISYRCGSSRSLLCVLAFCLSVVPALRADPGDCNDNGIPDTEELVVDFQSHGIAWGSGAIAGGLFTADLNSDGHPDAIWSQGVTTAATLSWQAGDGTGVFGSAQTIYTGIVRSPHSGDLDGDGDQDISFITSGVGFVWLENLDGAGSFGPARLFDPDATCGTLGDLDNDDDLDVVVSHASDDSLYRIMNLGGGTFDSPVLIRTIDQGCPRLLSDLNGDGNLDVVYSRNGGPYKGLHWIRNLGTGTFADPLAVMEESGVNGLAAADLDGDGDLDLAYTRSSTGWVALRWHENTNGQGEYGPPRTIEPTFMELGTLTAGDLDGDGDPDLLAVSHYADTYWWENLGGATFAEKRSAGASATGDSSGGSITITDIDGDGVLDYTFAVSEIFESWPDVFYYYSFRWYENGLDDCNADGVLDVCETDCNANGHADACDLITGAAVDCNASGSPDVCDVGCSTCDIDADGCLDEVDADPGNSSVCADSDTDGCDDCTTGEFDPGNDGPDADGDGYCWIGDCTDADRTAWVEPADTGSLTLTPNALETRLAWGAPGEPGGSVVYYDVVRSGDPSDFHVESVCLESDERDTEALEEEDPSDGAVFSYLVRVDNACPGVGTMGSDADGNPRSGRICP